MALERFNGRDGQSVEIDADEVTDIQPGDDPTYVVVSLRDGTKRYITGFVTDIFVRLDPHRRFGPWIKP